MRRKKKMKAMRKKMTVLRVRMIRRWSSFRFLKRSFI